MQALSFYTPINPKNSGSVRNNGLAQRKDKVKVFVLRSVFYVQLPRLNFVSIFARGSWRNLVRPVPRGLLFLTTLSFPLVVFLFPLLSLTFSSLILSVSFLCSEALFALSFSFLSKLFFGFYFVHAKAALAYPYSRNV